MISILTIVIICLFVCQVLKPERWFATFIAFFQKVLNKRIGGE